MQDWIDLRSDTVTRPTPAMREAMFEAEVGDDVYGEDPTVIGLETKVADLLGKDAGLFVASGTQSNLIALLTHCQRGDEYIAGSTAHSYQYEGGGAAALGGIQPQTLPFAEDGTLPLGEIERLIKPVDVHFANTRLLCLENTQSGKAAGPVYFENARELVDRHGLLLHLDGARYFNAVVATGCATDEISQHCDSVSICLSKGLGAPVGSVLVGSTDFIERARRWRKMVGGGMRQAGVIAAAGIYALDHHVERLTEDHQHAAEVAAALRTRFNEPISQHTNMVFLGIDEVELERLKAHLAAHQIRISRKRWVLHLDIDAQAVSRLIAAIDSYPGD